MPEFRAGVCMDCGGCVGVCPHDAIDLRNAVIEFRDACTECDLCVRLCPVDAIASLHPHRDSNGRARIAARSS